jgi:polyisoprenoid-binding protein YceI
MKKMILKMGILFVVATATFAFTLFVPAWNIDPNYSVKFSGKKAEGTFSGLKGEIQFDPNQLAKAKFDVTVDVATIKTGTSGKDKHAVNSDWFDAAQYPKIRFTSNSFEAAGSGFVSKGILDLHGVKKEVTIPFQFAKQNGKDVFSGKFNINRKDFGIKGNSFGFLVGDVFEVTLNVPVNR